MDWSTILLSGFYGFVIGIVVLIFTAKWAFAKADAKYDVLDNPFRHCLRFVGFAMIPMLPTVLAFNLLRFFVGF